MEVALYTPPVEEDVQSEESFQMQPQCTVEVQGVDPDPDKLELYEMYFSNPKRGGDTIVDIHLSEDDDAVLCITFETPEGKIV